jgi:hypothetical protein
LEDKIRRLIAENYRDSFINAIAAAAGSYTEILNAGAKDESIFANTATQRRLSDLAQIANTSRNTLAVIPNGYGPEAALIAPVAAPSRSHVPRSPQARVISQTVRDGLERACRDFTAAASKVGFARGKKMFWIRPKIHTADFIHFHRGGSTYGAPRNASVDIRVHFGIRVMNDPFQALALNGPYSDPEKIPAGRYHLRFNASTGSTYDRCVEDLVRFLVELGEPWFQQFNDTECLLRRIDSPLDTRARNALREAVAGHAKSENLVESRKLLGINDRNHVLSKSAPNG